MIGSVVKRESPPYNIRHARVTPGVRTENTMAKMISLTESQARTLRNVLAAGGNVRVTMGSLRKRPGAVQKTQVTRMIALGLLENMEAKGTYDRTFKPGTHRPGGIFATSLGCLALHAYDVAHTIIA